MNLVTQQAVLEKAATIDHSMVAKGARDEQQSNGSDEKR
jgi:hypothetical protein